MVRILSTVAIALLAGTTAAQASIIPVAATATYTPGTNAGPSFTSLRSMGYSTRNIVAGDTYGAAIIGQSVAGAGGAGGAAFVTAAGRTTSFVYDNAASLHGTLIGSNAVVNIGEATIVTSPTSFRYIVGAFTTDSSNLWISGLTIGGMPMSQGRFDVGAGAFTNGLLMNIPVGDIASISIVSSVFVDGASVATSTPLPNGRVLPEAGALVVWNGVVNSGVDEIQIIVDVTFVPAPGALALVGMGGLVALRRRR